MSNTQPNSPLLERVQLLIADAFQLPVDMITADLAFGDLPQWDSLGHMEVMMRLEEQFNLTVDTDMIAELISVAKICQYLQDHNAR